MPVKRRRRTAEWRRATIVGAEHDHLLRSMTLHLRDSRDGPHLTTFMVNTYFGIRFLRAVADRREKPGRDAGEIRLTESDFIDLPVVIEILPTREVRLVGLGREGDDYYRTRSED